MAADSVLAWFVLAVLFIAGCICFARYAIAEHDKYLYNRRHGWQ